MDNETYRAYIIDEGERAYFKMKESGVSVSNPYEAGTEEQKLWADGYLGASWKDTMKF